MAGWIKLHRKITDCKCLRPGPESERGAWIDIILLTSYEERTLEDGTILARGEWCHSDRFLASRWHWDKSKVRRFLAKLERQNMLKKRTTNRTTNRTTPGQIFETVNYNDYNPLNDNPNHPKNEKRTTNRTTNRTKDKEVLKNNINKDHSSTNISPNKKEPTLVEEYPFLESMGEAWQTAKAGKAINYWLEYKREKGQKYKPRGLQSLLNRIEKEFTPASLVAAVKHSTQANYAGLFADPKFKPLQAGRYTVNGTNGYKSSAEKQMEILEREEALLDGSKTDNKPAEINEGDLVIDADFREIS